MSVITGCDYSAGKSNFMITIHEMGHAFDLAHAEMWTETTTGSIAMKDPAGKPQEEKDGRPYTEYTDMWGVMGAGQTYQVRETENEKPRPYLLTVTVLCLP